MNERSTTILHISCDKSCFYFSRFNLTFIILTFNINALDKIRLELSYTGEKMTEVTVQVARVLESWKSMSFPQHASRNCFTIKAFNLKHIQEVLGYSEMQ